MKGARGIRWEWIFVGMAVLALGLLVKAALDMKEARAERNRQAQEQFEKAGLPRLAGETSPCEPLEGEDLHACWAVEKHFEGRGEMSRYPYYTGEED